MDGASDERTRSVPSPDRPGRQLEMLVAHLERLCVPLGAEVRSPDRVRDRSSGHYREVDISIRARVGSAEALVIVECRDWKRRQDVQWIEQIIGKRDGVGADLAVAVS